MDNVQSDDFELIYQYVEKRLRENGLAMKENQNSEIKGIVDELDKGVILDLF